MYTQLNFELMENKTQFWQNPVNSLFFFIFIFIKDNLILHIVIFKIYIFFLIYVLFNDTHLQLFQKSWSLYLILILFLYDT